MTQRGLQRVESLVRSEAKSVNQRVIAGAIAAVKDLRLQEYLQEIGLWVAESLLDSIILGYAVGRKSVYRDIKLSLDRPLKEWLTENEYHSLRMFFEFEARKLSSHIRRDFGNILTNWYRISEREGYSEEQASLALNLALKARGYGAKTARNLRTVFSTGFYSAYNGVRYADTRNRPEVWGFRYQTAGDEKVRDSHIVLQGVTLPKSDPWWNTLIPPLGYHCRCTFDILTEAENFVYPPSDARPDLGFESNYFQGFGSDMLDRTF